MRLEDIRYFLAVVETGHVGRAAETLGQTQPALTKGIQRLEKELHLQLFDRTPKGMALTSAGATFHARMQAVQAGLDEAVREAQDMYLGSVGVLRIGVPPNYIDYFGAVCGLLLEQRPAARVKLTMGLNDRLFSALRAGDVDLCISGQHNAVSPEFDELPLFSDDLRVIARDGHPLFLKPRLQLADLAQALWVLPNPDIAVRQWVDARFIEHGLPPLDVVVEVNTSSVALGRLLRTTDYLTIATESSLHRPDRRGLRPLPLREAVWPRRVGVTTRKGAYLSPLAQRFIELLQQHKPQDFTAA